MKTGALLAIVFSLAPGLAHATNRAELEFDRSSLTAGYSNWNDINFRNFFTPEGDNQFILELDYKNHFDESAVVFGGTITHTYTEDWYQDLSLTAGTNSRILPGFVGFTSIHRKFLPDRSLIAALGVGYVSSATPYSDIYGLAELTYYLPSLFSFQAGLRPNQSRPGSVSTVRYYGIVNLMIAQKIEAFVKFETGSEGYTVVGLNSFKFQFNSTNEIFQFRYWWSDRLGTSINVDLYQNPFFNRNSVGLGLMYNY